MPDILTAFLQDIRIASMHADKMMNVRTINQLLFPLRPVSSLDPNIIAICHRTFASDYLIGKQLIIAGNLVKTRNSDVASLNFVEAFSRADRSLNALFAERFCKGTAMPKQLCIII